MSDNSRPDLPRRPSTPWPPYLDFGSEPSRTLRPSPRPVSSIYSEYVPPYLDSLRPGGVPQPPISVPQRSVTVSARPSDAWVPPRVRGLEAPFPARQYSVSLLRHADTPASVQSRIPTPHPSSSTGPPPTRMERGRGIVTRPTTTAAVDLRRMYFDLQLQEWRFIPGQTQPSNLSTTGAENGPEKLRKRDRFKKFAKGLVQVVKDLRNPKDKQERDKETRRDKLRASVSAPLGNRALRR